MNLKQMVGIGTTEHVEDDMIVGLGTDSTVKSIVDEIGRRVREEGLSIVGIITSKETEKQALALDIPLKDIDEAPYMGLMIDDVDRISADFQGVKGGGAVLLFEKTVATYSKKCIWIVDKSKMANDLGAFPLPVEAVPYGNCRLVRSLEEKSYHPIPRLNAAGETLITDGGYRIIDLHLEKITNPEALGSYLDNLVGVVEHGLFLNMASMVIVGYEDGPKASHAPAR